MSIGQFDNKAKVHPHLSSAVIIGNAGYAGLIYLAGYNDYFVLAMLAGRIFIIDPRKSDNFTPSVPLRPPASICYITGLPSSGLFSAREL